MVRLVDANGTPLWTGHLKVGFSDTLLNDILSPTLSVYIEPTVLESDDGSQIDLWVNDWSGNCWYSYSTNGVTFAEAVETDCPTSYGRHCVLKIGATYYRYAVSYSTGATMHLMTSTDKLHWADQGQVLAKGTAAWENQWLGNVFVWREGASDWKMLYDAQGDPNSTHPWSVGLATSSDGLTWSRYAGNPIILGVYEGVQYGCGRSQVARLKSDVLKIDGRYYLYIHGHIGDLDGPVQRAYSTDLVNWTMEGVITGIRQVHGDDHSYGDCCLVQFQGKTVLLWTATDQISTGHVDGGIDNRSLNQLLAIPPSGDPMGQPLMSG